MNHTPAEEGDIPETDFSGGVRGKYYDRATQGTNSVLEPNEAQVFRDDETFEVSSELEAVLLQSIAQGEHGKTIAAEDLLDELRRRESSSKR